ncbi:MAG: glycosyltransferase family 4 protein [Kiritimatiellae bacterium]|nr:glycosyltransferase family 4 protein [Kiritimatiellia bacterium]
MNILFVNMHKGQGIYGVERWMLSLGGGLVARRHWVGLVGHPGGPLKRPCLEKGISYRDLRIRSGLELIAALKLRRFLCAHRVEAVCVKGYRELRVAAIARIGFNTRLFIRRGARGDVRNRPWDRLHLLGLAPCVIVPSRFLQEEILSIPWARGIRIEYLPLGVNLAEYNGIREGASTKHRMRQVLYVGRLMRLKGTDILLEAWSRVVSEVPEVKLTLVGENAPEWERLARKLSLDVRSVEFVGFQSDVRPWLAQSDLLVLPSREEGSGQVIVEAMAMGKPVVASRVGGIPEYVSEGETGILVPPADSTALAGALVALLSSPERLSALGRAALERARSEFDSGKIIDRFLALVTS